MNYLKISGIKKYNAYLKHKTFYIIMKIKYFTLINIAGLI
jgi:hypothetical protein